MQRVRLSAIVRLLGTAAPWSLQALQEPVQPLPGYPDLRRVEGKGEFANVGALITVAEKNDAEKEPR
jgi:hypothetical protein